MRACFTGLIILGMAAGVAQANLLTNASFETPASSGSPSLNVGSTYLPGWTVIVAEVAQIRNGDFAGVFASAGTYSMDLTGYHDGVPYGGVRQTINTTAGFVYSLSFDVGAVNGLSLIQALAGDLNSTGSSASGGGTDVWTNRSFTFTASGATTNIDLIGIAPSANGTYIGLDNVDVELVRGSSTPEPATLFLTSTTLLALLALRRRSA